MRSKGSQQGPKTPGAIYIHEHAKYRIEEHKQAAIAQEKNKDKIKINVKPGVDIFVSKENILKKGEQYYIDYYLEVLKSKYDIKRGQWISKYK